MNLVTIYSRPSFSSEHLMELIKKQAEIINLDIHLRLITDINIFIKKNIQHAPTIEFKGERLEVENNNFKRNSQSICDWIFDTIQKISFKKIIVPIDFSETSGDALEYALSLNKLCRVNLSLLHVHRIHPGNFNELSMTFPIGIEKRNESFNSFVAKIKNGFSTSESNRQLINGNFIIGFPADEIIKYSDAFPESLTIMGQRKEKTITNKIFGSTTAKVGLESKRNVLIIPPGKKFKPVEKIAFCIQSEKENEKAAKTISNLTKFFNAEFHLIHIQNGENISKEDTLKFWVKYFKEQPIKLHTIFNDDIALGIHNKCSELNIDLLAANRKYRSFISLILNRSITKRLINNSDIPFLITHH